MIDSFNIGLQTTNHQIKALYGMFIIYYYLKCYLTSGGSSSPSVTSSSFSLLSRAAGEITVEEKESTLPEENN